MNGDARPRGHMASSRVAGPLAQQSLTPSSSETRECQICSYSQEAPERKKPVFHNHFSSIFLRRLIGVERTEAPSLCPSCMNQHVPYPNKRLKLVISDSSLHHFFAPPGSSNTLQYSGDSIHIDYLTIAGADLDSLINAFRLEYMSEMQERPMDVVVVAGYSDLVEERSRYDILNKLHILVHTVMDETRARNLPPDEGNSVAVGTLMYPPQLAWLPADGPFPYKGYKNNWDKITSINEQIKVLNNAYNSRNPPQFHTYGLRTSMRTSIDRYGHVSTMSVKSHRWEHWREPNPAEMLHLNNERRFKMATAINNYFQFNTLN